ncbi:MAG: thermonuclease family protein [bacterium]|nr:thermonuclease family protein [bacterium]
MSRKILIGVFVIGALFGLTIGRALPKRLQSVASIAQSAAVESAQNAEPIISGTYYPVIKVVDGDTIVVEINGKNETIRLIGLDTPETVDPRKPVQCFGEEASKKAKEILAGKSVQIEMDASQGERDKYGRLLAYIFLEDGTSFNKLMIAEGFGHEYTYNPSTGADAYPIGLPYKYQEEFKQAEKTARENQKGLWADAACGRNSERSPKSDVAYRPLSEAISNTGSYACSSNAYDCTDFSTQAEAQYVFELCGLPAAPDAAQAGGDQNDIHKLDRDGDGKVCESLP